MFSCIQFEVLQISREKLWRLLAVHTYHNIARTQWAPDEPEKKSVVLIKTYEKTLHQILVQVPIGLSLSHTLRAAHFRSQFS